ncbi:MULTISPECIES: hypothetical protein [unclassified Pseudomonas]|uniref:hypothetical protein n=1 Tax=unclassified Pseudomonas TaxID=196821 RepID=UPI002AC97465|nr:MULTISPECIES: hypothetical protein [unclassified Pseudomonas]MEB0044628.1 hypothetical protein [Pseudomonas sp. Dout3]MEB0095826.1 hypothetical protein [Pseudomonas sp. DC1.2]WPX58128.1 hypothetical protein RHM68_21435 [Pseudomonas sp. DC1.2]
MKLPSTALLLACALFLPTAAQASDAALTETLKAFTRCDASFFASLNTHRDAWGAFAPLKQEKNAAWITVKNRGSSPENSMPLLGTPVVAGMKLLSYVDESSDLGQLGHYYYWGFIVEGSVNEVAKRLAPLMEQPKQLQNVGSSYVRSEIKVGDQWRVIQPQPGTAPGSKRVERVLIVEAEGKQGNQSRVNCSVQGAVDGAMLAQLRPDIAPADYPQPQPDTSITGVAVPEEVLKRLDSPLLIPKFKTLSYTYATKTGDKVNDRPVTIEYTADGGLLKKNEIYSEAFHVERLTQAGLIQLKSKMNGIGDGRVLLTRELEVKTPTSWSPGQTLSARLVMEEVPARPTDKPIKLSTTCTVGQRFPARQVFASLTGDAIALECEHDNSKTSNAFIEDLGVSLILESTSNKTSSVYTLTALDVVR